MAQSDLLPPVDHGWRHGVEVVAEPTEFATVCFRKAAVCWVGARVGVITGAVPHPVFTWWLCR